MTRPSLQLQVAAFAILGILICFVVTFFVAVWFPIPEPKRISVSEVVQALQATDVPQGWRRSVVQAPPFETAPEGPDIVIRAGLAAALDLPQDRIRVRSLKPSRPQAPARMVSSARLSSPLSDRATIVVRRLALSPGSRFGLFATAVQQPGGDWISLTPRISPLTPERGRMLIALALAAGVIIPLAVWGSSLLTAPFRRLEQAAADDARLDSAAWVGGPVEARSAAAAMDAMRYRLMDHLRTRTAMMAAIAHDLRTPLTGLRLRVEGLTGASHAEAVADIGRMERMIAQLLTYVRGEEVAWVTEPVDLADVVEDCVRRQQRIHPGIRFERAGEQLVLADRDQLDRAMSNLIDNAVIYGGGARIEMHTNEAEVICSIDDNGPGMPPDKMDAVFEPFHRLDASRNRNTGGAGLGLAIVRSILRRAGGDVQLNNLPAGGLRAEVRLPALKT